MHQSSFDKMQGFRHRYLDGKEGENLSILDLGSLDVNGTYRPLFNVPSWNYHGLDMAEGSGVDIVLKSPYRWKEISSNSMDVVLSGQAFEHIEYFWISMLEIGRVLKPGGLCCLIAPSAGREHRYPVDCWRFYADGFSALAKFSQMEVIDVSTQWEPLGYEDGSDEWRDSFMVCRKPRLSGWKAMKSNLKRYLLHKVNSIGI